MDEQIANIENQLRELEMTKYYCLDENNDPVECDRAMWKSNLNSTAKVVNFTRVGRFGVSTVFIGMDHMFETAIFDIWKKEETRIHLKYSTWEAAKVGHKKAVEYAGSELVPF